MITFCWNHRGSNWLYIGSPMAGLLPHVTSPPRPLDAERRHSSQSSLCLASRVFEELPRCMVDSWSQPTGNGHSTESQCVMDWTRKATSFNFASPPPNCPLHM